MMNGRLYHNTYTVRRKVLKLFGGAFHVYDPAGSVVLYSEMKAFKLREDIRLYSGEDMQTELMLIKARHIIDFSATYDVFDSVSGQKIGALRRKGLKSILRDEWILLNQLDQEIGTIKEDSTGLAVIRRVLLEVLPFNVLPQEYHAEVNGMRVCTYKQNFNPFVTKIKVDFTNDPGRVLDRRLGLAGGLMLCAIEGKE